MSLNPICVTSSSRKPPGYQHVDKWRSIIFNNSNNKFLLANLHPKLLNAHKFLPSKEALYFNVRAPQIISLNSQFTDWSMLIVPKMVLMQSMQ